MLHYSKTHKKSKRSNTVLWQCVVYILRSSAISIEQGANNAFGDVRQTKLFPHFEIVQFEFTPCVCSMRNLVYRLVSFIIYSQLFRQFNSDTTVRTYIIDVVLLMHTRIHSDTV